MKTLKILIGLSLVLTLTNCKKEETLTPNNTTVTAPSVSGIWHYESSIEVDRDLDTDAILRQVTTNNYFSTFDHKFENGEYYRSLINFNSYSLAGEYNNGELKVGAKIYTITLNGDKLILENLLSTNTNNNFYTVDIITLKK